MTPKAFYVKSLDIIRIYNIDPVTEKLLQDRGVPITINDRLVCRELPASYTSVLFDAWCVEVTPSFNMMPNKVTGKDAILREQKNDEVPGIQKTDVPGIQESELVKLPKPDIILPGTLHINNQTDFSNLDIPT
jgi:hypothetical protein